MKLTEERLKEIIREEYQKLNEGISLSDMEASIFDIVIQFKKAYEKSPHKKNKQINALIKQMLKLEGKLGDLVTELE